MNLLRGGKPVPIDPDVRAGGEESKYLSAWNTDAKRKLDRSGGFFWRGGAEGRLALGLGANQCTGLQV